MALDSLVRKLTPNPRTYLTKVSFVSWINCCLPVELFILAAKMCILAGKIYILAAKICILPAKIYIVAPKMNFNYCLKRVSF